MKFKNRLQAVIRSGDDSFRDTERREKGFRQKAQVFFSERLETAGEMPLGIMEKELLQSRMAGGLFLDNPLFFRLLW